MLNLWKWLQIRFLFRNVKFFAFLTELMHLYKWLQTRTVQPIAHRLPARFAPLKWTTVGHYLYSIIYIARLSWLIWYQVLECVSWGGTGTVSNKVTQTCTFFPFMDKLITNISKWHKNISYKICLFSSFHCKVLLKYWSNWLNWNI